MTPLDLPRVQRALASLDRAAAAGVRPLPPTWRRLVKPAHLRLTEEQADALRDLAERLPPLHPELRLMGRGGNVSPYTVLRWLVDRGIRDALAELDRADEGTP